jgi:hypothetical protein
MKSTIPIHKTFHLAATVFTETEKEIDSYVSQTRIIYLPSRIKITSLRPALGHVVARDGPIIVKRTLSNSGQSASHCVIHHNCCLSRSALGDDDTIAERYGSGAVIAGQRGVVVEVLAD